MKAGANRPKKKKFNSKIYRKSTIINRKKKLIKKTSNQTENCKKKSKDSGENSSKTTICSIFGTRYQSNSGCNNGQKRKKNGQQIKTENNPILNPDQPNRKKKKRQKKGSTLPINSDPKHTIKIQKLEQTSLN